MKPEPQIQHKLESADQACARLNISAQTLYAYVSRNLLRTSNHPTDSRMRLYYSVDIDRLIDRQKRGRSRKEIAQSTLDFGEPILASKLSNITDGTYFYRGQSAISLSESATLESLFELLCQTSIKPNWLATKSYYISKHHQPVARFADALVNRLATDNSFGNKRSAFYLMQLMACNATQQELETTSQEIHLQLANAWSADPRAPDLIRRALVLSADHELNASTYASRVTASSGANLSACLLTGISTLSGAHHGGLTDACAHWMHETSKRDAGKLQISPNTPPPGFAHRLYPNGDPRATEILKHCPPPRSWQRLARKVKSIDGTWHPTLDFGLATLEHQLKLPKGSGFSIFAVGRTVGWLAHCFEQRKTVSLIRPRATHIKNA